MYKDEYKAVCNSAAAKLNLLKNNPLGYFVASILAGMFVAMGSFCLLYTSMLSYKRLKVLLKGE